MALKRGLPGFFEYNWMPFGLTNSPAMYQKRIEECLSYLQLKRSGVSLSMIALSLAKFSTGYGKTTCK